MIESLCAIAPIFMGFAPTFRKAGVNWCQAIRVGQDEDVDSSFNGGEHSNAQRPFQPHIFSKPADNGLLQCLSAFNLANKSTRPVATQSLLKLVVWRSVYEHSYSKHPTESES